MTGETTVHENPATERSFVSLHDGPKGCVVGGNRLRDPNALPIARFHRILTMNGGKGSRSTFTFLDPHAIGDIRRRAQNNLIARLQSRADVDASAIVRVEIDHAKFDLSVGKDTDLQAVLIEDHRLKEW
jgi:hypothetical protein